MTMYSCVCCFSKLEHIARYKAENQITVRANFFRTRARANTHAHTLTSSSKEAVFGLSHFVLLLLLLASVCRTARCRGNFAIVVNAVMSR